MALGVTAIPYQQNGAPSCFADLLDRNAVLAGGAKLDPTAFNSADAVLVKLSAAAAIGAPSLAVDALLGAVPANTFLNFGTLAPVTVTVNDADVNAGETGITVAALSGPIPAGTILEFSGAGAGFAKLTAAAIAGATSLVVAALAEDIDNGATATFPGGTQQARVTTAATAGATTVAVDELQFGIADNAEARYAAPGTVRRVPAATLVGWTYAEITAAAVVTDGVPAGLALGPAADTDDEVRFVVYDVVDADERPDADLYRTRRLIYENHVPGWAALSSTLKAKVRATYECTVGATEV